LRGKPFRGIGLLGVVGPFGLGFPGTPGLRGGIGGFGLCGTPGLLVPPGLIGIFFPFPGNGILFFIPCKRCDVLFNIYF
jgi:hypothetical protein